MTSPHGVVAFDLDGTLLPNTTVSLHLGPWLGHHDIGDLERLYAQGRITNSEIAEREAAFFRARRREDVWRQLDQLEFIDGLIDTMKWVKDAALVPVIATVTSTVAAEFVCRRFGFAAASGCELGETENGIFLGTVAQHFEAKDKVTFVAQVAQSFALGMEDVVAIGDSTSDIPLFHAAGFSIALNASRNAREAAVAELNTHDLRDVIPLIDGFFGDRADPRRA